MGDWGGLQTRSPAALKALSPKVVRVAMSWRAEQSNSQMTIEFRRYTSSKGI